jgi:hypothetical protein
MYTIFSINPSLRNNEGHQYEYNKAFTQASKLNGWNHIKIIPKKCILSDLDNSWIKSIYGIGEKNKFKNFFKYLKLFKIFKKRKNAVLFVEDFNFIILFQFFLCILVVRPKIKFWFLMHFEHNIMFLKGRSYLIILQLIEAINGKKNIKYLTDSDLIAKKNGEFFKRDFIILPIPHTKTNFSEIRSQKDCLIFWWPGGLTREEKGLFRIKKIAEIMNENDEPIILEISQSASQHIPSNQKISYVPHNITRKEYNEKMIGADLILLPYLEQSYAYRTSGIFVEAIVNGKICAISKGTWMANEAKKYDLSELIIDWNSPDVLKLLIELSKNKKVKEKVQIMRENYLKFHNVENFARHLKMLI